ncbi:hypothetical protein WSK_1013 [Novosphingobium sp. Rr 2-17]|uniref:hypothetical protein n=1 Tax=Novosphingobium sp. Rr 2-17 TaxID=555793 RepID=UPI0002699836|nr:hypothetical protein [Novosphingobium sp. Rr 2-17]EIZ80453.1 hypothetical protein WSK_1013 [Novosphingobium sp. Rr 2-17]
MNDHRALPPQPDGRTGWSRLSGLYALVPAGMLLVLLLRRVWDVDIFWQLKLGELILAHHGPIAREPFAALHLGEPLPAVAWAGQALMAGARLLGGWSLLRLFDALCWLGGFWAVAWACRRRGASAPAVALALGLAFVAALPTASIRPQSFGCLCFGLLLALQRLGLRPRTTILLGVPLLVAWQNLHPSVSVGALAMGVTALVGWIAWAKDRSRPIPLAPSALAAAALAAIFATPDGIGILDVSARNADASMAIGASEWLPLWIAGNHTNALPVVLVAAIAAWFVVRHRGRIDVSEIAVALALLALTVTAYRFVVFWAIAMVPVIARAAEGFGGTKESRPPQWLAATAVAVVALLVPSIAPTRFANSLPLAAIAHLKRQHVSGTIYADFPFGGPVIDAGYPNWHVAYDGRYYRYSRDEWRYNGGIENGIVPLIDVMHKWNPAAFVLNERHNSPLVQELARSRAWQRIYAGEGVVVYVPRIIRRASRTLHEGRRGVDKR